MSLEPWLRWPGLKKAALAIAYDSGAVSAEETESDILRNMSKAFSSYDTETLQRVNDWLVTLNAEQFHFFCVNGADDEVAKLIKKTDVPVIADRILNHFFEEM